MFWLTISTHKLCICRNILLFFHCIYYLLWLGELCFIYIYFFCIHLFRVILAVFLLLTSYAFLSLSNENFLCWNSFFFLHSSFSSLALTLTVELITFFSFCFLTFVSCVFFFLSKWQMKFYATRSQKLKNREVREEHIELSNRIIKNQSNKLNIENSNDNIIDRQKECVFFSFLLFRIFFFKLYNI